MEVSPEELVSSQGDFVEGFTVGDHNTFKCWMAVMEYGKQTLICIFNWGYTKPNSQIEQEILQQQSVKQYRRDFDSMQKEKIKKANIMDFDITLLYLLIQRICGLPKPNDPSWTEEYDENSLPYLLNQIKKNRNKLAHTKTAISFNEMVNKLNFLKDLFIRALGAAGDNFSIESGTVKFHQKKIETSMESLKSTNMDKLALANLFQVATKEKADIAKMEARSELQLWYLQLCKVCLDYNHTRQYNIEDVFTTPLIKHKNESIVLNEVPEQGIVDLRKVFRTKTPTGEIPAIILILSNPGFGKTTLSKYILYCWTNSLPYINELNEFDVVIYIDFRESHGTNLDGYIEEILPQTVGMFGISEFKRYLMFLNVLFILDNIDCVKNERKSMFDEILRFKSTGIRYLATSTQNVSSTFNLRSSPHHKPSLPLHLKGLHGETIKQCINKLYNTRSLQSPEVEQNIESFRTSYMTNTKPTFGVFHSPEILSHTFSQWISENTPPDKHTTKTRLYVTNLKLLQTKLWNNGNHLNIFEKMSLNKSIQLYLDQISLIAFQNIETSPEIPFEDFDALVDLGKKLSLPYENLLQSVFYVKENLQCSGMRTVFLVTFRSVSEQIFYCSLHLTKMVSKPDFKNALASVIKVGIEETSVNLLLKFMLGLMTSGFYPCLEHQLRDFLSFMNEECKVTTSTWLELINESNQHEEVVKAVRNYFGKHWSFQDISNSCTLTNLFSENFPETMKLSFSDLHCCVNIIPILRACSKVSNIQLSLHIFCHSWMKNLCVSDEYLEESQKLQIELRSFAGKLSTSFYQFLPNTLQSLALQVSPEDIDHLNKAIGSMVSLKMLYLNFFFEGNEKTRSFSKVRVPRRETVFSVDIWNATADDVESVCDFVRRISQAYCRLVLRRTNFNFRSTEAWINGIRERRIHLDTMVIGSVTTLDQTEEEKLRNMALSFECSEFKWLKLNST